MQLTQGAVVALVAVGVSLADSQSAVPLKPLPAIQLETARDARLDGPRFSLAFSQPTPIADVLLLLVRDTRLSVVPDPGLDQRFIGDLKNVTLREALDLILEPLGLDYAVRGQVIRVFPRELETRLFTIDHVITQRTGRRTLGGPTEVASTDAPDLYADLAAGVRALISSEGRVNVDRTAALLQVTDRPSRLARVEQYLEAVMHRVMRQVQIDAKVVEVELRAGSNAIDWNAALTSVGRAEIAPPRPTSGFTMAITSSNAGALLTALGGQGTVTVLSNAIVPAMNNQPAVMRVGIQAAHTLADGVALSITPQIGSDGVIHMSVSASVTRRAGAVDLSLANARPVIVRETDTVVRVRQAETVLMTGLTHESASPAPGKGKTELVILLTPTILEAAAR